MILAAIILGAVAIVGTGLIIAFWNNIVEWLKKAIATVSEMIKRVIYGTKVFIRKFAEGIKEISKHYSQDTVGQWHETIVTRKVSAEEVPEEIRARAFLEMETDISNELVLQISS